MVEWFNFIYKMEWFLFCWGGGCNILNYSRKFLLTSLTDMLLSGFPCKAWDVGEEKIATGGKLA